MPIPTPPPTIAEVLAHFRADLQGKDFAADFIEKALLAALAGELRVDGLLLSDVAE